MSVRKTTYCLTASQKFLSVFGTTLVHYLSFRSFEMIYWKKLAKEKIWSYSTQPEATGSFSVGILEIVEFLKD